MKKNGADGLNEVKVVTRSMLKGKNVESVSASFEKLVNDATADVLVLVGFPEEVTSDIFLRFTDSVIEIKCEYIDDEDEQREYEEEQRALAEEQEGQDEPEEEEEGEEGEEEKEEEDEEEKEPEEQEEEYHHPKVMSIINKNDSSFKLNTITCTSHHVVLVERSETRLCTFPTKQCYIEMVMMFEYFVLDLLVYTFRVVVRLVLSYRVVPC